MDILSIALAKRNSGSSESTIYKNFVLQGEDTGHELAIKDALPNQQLIELIAYGHSIQNGTPTPQNPIPIKSIAQIELAISGQDQSNFNTTNLILVDKEGIQHKMCSLPNGRQDQLVIKKDGSSILYKRAAERTIVNVGTMETSSGNHKQAMLFFDKPLDSWDSVDQMQTETNTTDSILGYCSKCGHEKDNSLCVGRVWDNAYAYITSATATQETFNSLIGATVIMRQPVAAYDILSVMLPSLPENNSYVWLIATSEDGSSINTNVKATYQRDLNLTINNIEEAISDIVSKA